MEQTLEKRTFAALQAMTEGILTRGDPDYMRRRLNECVEIMAEHGWQTPTPWPLVEPLHIEFSGSGECDCEDKSQCWEPCGELGKSDAHATVWRCDACRAVGALHCAHPDECDGMKLVPNALAQADAACGVSPGAMGSAAHYGGRNETD